MYQQYMDRMAAAVSWEQEKKLMNQEAEKLTGEISDEKTKALQQALKQTVVTGNALGQLESALDKLNSQKSQDRTAKDRYIAIAVTDLEKLIAFVKMYC